MQFENQNLNDLTQDSQADSESSISLGTDGTENRLYHQPIKKEDMNMKYECPCGYVYDPEVGDPDSGIAPGTAWEDIPEDWVCPICGLGKDAFTEA